jgi:hypothetical protein
MIVSGKINNCILLGDSSLHKTQKNVQWHKNEIYFPKNVRIVNVFSPLKMGWV